MGHDFARDDEGARQGRLRPVAAVDQARAALVEDVGAADVGEHLGHEVEGERVVTHLFACTRTGYAGWRWSVTLAGPRARRRSPSTRSC